MAGELPVVARSKRKRSARGGAAHEPPEQAFDPPASLTGLNDKWKSLADRERVVREREQWLQHHEQQLLERAEAMEVRRMELNQLQNTLLRMFHELRAQSRSIMQQAQQMQQSGAVGCGGDLDKQVLAEAAGYGHSSGSEPAQAAAEGAQRALAAAEGHQLRQRGRGMTEVLESAAGNGLHAANVLLGGAAVPAAAGDASGIVRAPQLGGQRLAAAARVPMKGAAFPGNAGEQTAAVPGNKAPKRLSSNQGNLMDLLQHGGHANRSQYSCNPSKSPQWEESEPSPPAQGEADKAGTVTNVNGLTRLAEAARLSDSGEAVAGPTAPVHSGDKTGGCRSSSDGIGSGMLAADNTIPSGSSATGTAGELNSSDRRVAEIGGSSEEQGTITLGRLLDYKSCEGILCLTKPMAKDLLPSPDGLLSDGQVSCQMDIALVDELGREWDVTYRCVPSRYSYELRAGWRSFCLNWGVQQGDRITLQRRGSNRRRLYVKVFKSDPAADPAAEADGADPPSSESIPSCQTVLRPGSPHRKAALVRAVADEAAVKRDPGAAPGEDGNTTPEATNSPRHSGSGSGEDAVLPPRLTGAAAAACWQAAERRANAAPLMLSRHLLAAVKAAAMQDLGACESPALGR